MTNQRTTPHHFPRRPGDGKPFELAKSTFDSITPSWEDACTRYAEWNTELQLKIDEARGILCSNESPRIKVEQARTALRSTGDSDD